jgi:hypothetical protein
MNWHWLFVEILEREVPSERIVLANPFKTRIIAEAQIKTDKVDARILADLLRGRLVSSVHIAGRATRQIKEVLRQRCFFVRQRIRRLPDGAIAFLVCLAVSTKRSCRNAATSSAARA